VKTPSESWNSLSNSGRPERLTIETASRGDKVMKASKTLLTVVLIMSALTMAENEEAEGSYASVNGLKMYHEIQGADKRALVLVHGGVGSIEMFGRGSTLLKSRQ